MYLLEINDLAEDQFEVIYSNGRVHFTKIFTCQEDALEFVGTKLSASGNNE